jgi:hypothetical protein
MKRTTRAQQWLKTAKKPINTREEQPVKTAAPRASDVNAAPCEALPQQISEQRYQYKYLRNETNLEDKIAPYQPPMVVTPERDVGNTAKQDHAAGWEPEQDIEKIAAIGTEPEPFFSYLMPFEAIRP